MSAHKAAELAGERYYEGRPCLVCLGTKRLVSNRVCYECNKRRSRERAQRKKEAEREAVKQRGDQ